MEFRLSLATELNDPFELAPNVPSDQFSAEKIKSIYLDPTRQAEAYEVWGKPRGLSKRSFKMQHEVRAVSMAERDAQNAERAAAKMKAEFGRNFERHFGLICATTDPDSILMWSHYALNHLGIVIEFETDDLGLGESCPAIQVTYTTERPNWQHFSETSEFADEAWRIATTKAVQWRYEKEYRIIIPRDAQLLGEGRFLKIPPRAIKSVTLGCRATDQTGKEVIEAITGKPIELRLANQHESEYALTIQHGS